jgi:hypothetical protein
VRSLPKVRFNIINVVNASMSFSLFNLKSGHSPQLIPLLLHRSRVFHIIVTPSDTTPEETAAQAINAQLEMDIQEVRDLLMAAKILQSHYVNVNWDSEPTFEVGDKIMLAIKNRQREYMQGQIKQIAKFMPRFDGPYEITTAHPEPSNYILLIPNHKSNKTTMFHICISRHIKRTIIHNSLGEYWNNWVLSLWMKDRLSTTSKRYWMKESKDKRSNIW